MFRKHLYIFYPLSSIAGKIPDIFRIRNMIKQQFSAEKKSCNEENADQQTGKCFLFGVLHVHNCTLPLFFIKKSHCYNF